MKSKMKTVIFYILSFIVGGLALVSFSCTYFTEPEPEVNASVRPPQTHTKTGVFSNYSADQVVAGTITPHFVPDWGTSGTDSITVFLDSMYIECLHPLYDQNYNSNNPFQFSINTATRPDGRHEFTLHAFKRPSISDSIGLLSLKYNALYSYTTSLIFDNTPPTAPTNLSITLQNGYPVISWTPTDLRNFYSYIIRKDGKAIAIIYAQQTSSYTDSTLPDFYRGYYEVGASNGPATAYSPEVTCTKGTFLGLSYSNAVDNLNDQVVFNLSNNNLVSVSTQTGTVIAQCYNGHDGLWAKDIDNDTLYCWNQQYLYTYDVSTLNILRSQKINISSSSRILNEVTAFTVGPGNKLYVAVDYWNFSQGDAGIQIYLNIFNGNDPEFNIGYPHVVDFGSAPTFLSVSPDGKNFLAGGIGLVRSYSMESDLVTLVDSSTMARWFRPDWKNSRVFVAVNKNPDKEEIETWDIRTLNRISAYDLPVSFHYYGQLRTSAFFANSSRLYVAYNSNLLAEYDIGTQQLTRSWTFQTEIQSLLGSDNGRYLFACTSTEQWIVDIGGGQ